MIFRNQGLSIKKTNTLSQDELVKYYGLNSYEFTHLNKRTALVIAHRLATIEKSDKILVLKGGALIEEGNHKELRLKRGLYFQLSELQEKGFASF